MKLKIKISNKKVYVKRHYGHTCQQKKGKAQMKILVAVCPLTASTAAQHFVFQFMLVLIFKCYCQPRVFWAVFLFLGLKLLREAVMPSQSSHMAFCYADSHSQSLHLQVKKSSLCTRAEGSPLYQQPLPRLFTQVTSQSAAQIASPVIIGPSVCLVAAISSPPGETSP